MNLAHQKIYLPKRARGREVELLQASSESHEADSIVTKMRDLQAEEDRTWKDFVVLYRTNAQSRSFEEAFMRTGVPYQIIGGVRFYERKEVKDLISYLRLIFNPNDSVSFDRIINVPTRGIGAKASGNPKLHCSIRIALLSLKLN